MPLQAIAIQDFNIPLMRQSRTPSELKTRILSLYNKDKRYHKYSTGKEALDAIEQSFQRGWLYVGMFNDKPICAIQGIQINESINLSNLVMHVANQNRGIEEQFIALICQNNNMLVQSDISEIQIYIDKNNI